MSPGGKQPDTHCTLTWNGNIVLNFIDFEGITRLSEMCEKAPPAYVETSDTGLDSVSFG